MGCRSVIQNALVAITFAEANCHKIAKEYLRGCTKPTERRTPIEEFASIVGIDGVNFKFGMVTA